MTVELGVLLALASAGASQLGFLLRHRGARAAPAVDVRHPLRSAVGLFRSRWWTVGYAVAAGAYFLHVGALALAPLSLVQAVLAAGLVVLGVIAERWFGLRLGRREWTGIALAATGLALLALTGTGPAGTASAGYSLPAMIAWESALVGIGALLIVAHGHARVPSGHGLLLGVAAGLLFTVTHVAVKALTGTAEGGITAVLASPYVAIAAATAAAAFFASARSLQVGEAVSVIAITSIASNASSIPAGIVVFGDPVGGEAGGVALRATAFVMVVVAAALIPAPTRIASGRSRAAPPAPARGAR